MGQQALHIFQNCIPLFQVLSDNHRQSILLMLSERGKMTVNEITEQSSLSRPAISHHLKLLLEKGLISVEQKGTQRYYSASLQSSVAMLKELVAALEEECI
ncbi:ArsR family transcriptional regulator [Paenibacillus sp. Root52]|uniref:DNA-binding transcriptional ArsR family regulator n=1 Tax=Paenibacillus amylolyticus TaxID=1451 RepID=A0AAP5H1X8_PAEAM|nr:MULTISPECIES: metalloregulator ArsR/SmtB family transcription factor [Paenibacillus]KQY94568.1 ArsR family transcriptional regulator [Paenibacillus sp. Root52]MCG7379719.1 metalloregulator ArsR/SmtB family transcription factor [Paenibacillus sp. ACRSA]MDR6724322.1 DNA-binding transcriptional ArsR family regulator [Paenibacillus amylolyticus]